MIAQPKPKTFRSAKYLAFVRSKGCVLCGSRYNVAAHHTEGAGVGLKGSDYSCVGLCPEHHRKVHDLGRKNLIPGLENIIQGLREEWERLHPIQPAAGP